MIRKLVIFFVMISSVFFLFACDFFTTTTTRFTVPTELSTSSSTTMTTEATTLPTTLETTAPIVEYTVTFNSMGGTPCSSVVTASGTTITLPVSTKEGFTFNGWYTGFDVSDSEFTVLSVVTRDLTLYALWEINTYTIAFVTNGGEYLMPVAYEFDAMISTPTPVREGYSFVNWYTDEELTMVFDLTNMPSHNLTIYAKWDINEYTVSYVMDGGSPISSYLLEYGSSITEPLTPTKEGYHFLGWYSEPSLTEVFVFTTMPAHDVTIYAKWEVIYYTIYLEGVEGTSSTDFSLGYGAVVTIPNPTKFGYTFIGWYMDEALTEEFDVITMPSHDITVYAKWEADLHTITFDSNGGSEVASITLGYETEIFAPEDPTKPGYNFMGWYIDTGYSTMFVFTTMPGYDLTLYAKWEAGIFTITFNTNGGDEMSPMSAAYGMVITEPTPTREGYKFDFWYTDESLTEIYFFTTMPAENFTLYAKWEIDHFSISFEVNGGSEVATITQDYLSVVTAPDDPTKDYVMFDGWYEDELFTTPYTFTTMPAHNTVLYAKWSPYPVDTILEGRAYPLGTYILWRGMTVLGTATGGFFITDGSDAMFVYGTTLGETVVTGMVYDIIGGIGLYYNVAEIMTIGSRSIYVLASSAEPVELTPTVATIDEIIANHVGYDAENPMYPTYYTVTGKVYYDSALYGNGTYLIYETESTLDKAHAIRIYYQSNIAAVTAHEGQVITLNIMIFAYNSNPTFLDWYCYYVGTIDEILHE